jgi:hypothetical protein
MKISGQVNKLVGLVQSRSLWRARRNRPGVRVAKVVRSGCRHARSNLVICYSVVRLDAESFRRPDLSTSRSVRAAGRSHLIRAWSHPIRVGQDPQSRSRRAMKSGRRSRAAMSANRLTKRVCLADPARPRFSGHDPRSRAGHSSLIVDGLKRTEPKRSSKPSTRPKAVKSRHHKCFSQPIVERP